MAGPPPIIVAAVAQTKRKRRRPPRMPTMPYPDLITRRYRRLLTTWARRAAAILAREMEPVLRWAEEQEQGAREDGPMDWIRSILAKAKQSIFRTIGPLKAQILKIADEVDAQNKNALNRQFREVIGIDPIKTSTQLATLQDWEARNRGLIKIVANGEVEKLEGRVIQAVRSGTPSKKVKEAVERFGDVSESRATLLARDQIGKLVGQITRERHEDLGVKEYIWRTARDERVVGNPAGLYPKGSQLHQNHWEREGKKFKYDDPPEDGNPGEPIQCRCYAEPVIPGL